MKKHKHLLKLAALNTFIATNTFAMERDNIQDEAIQTDNAKTTSENISELIRVLLLLGMRICMLLLCLETRKSIHKH